MIKTIYKATTNFILNVEKLEAFPLRSGTHQACPHSPLVLRAVLEVVASVIHEEKETKDTQKGINCPYLQMI